MRIYLLTLSSVFLTISHTSAQNSDTQLPLGLEAVTGYRTNYLQKGIDLAQDSFDFQLQGEISLSDSLFLGFGGWYLTETAKGDYAETGAHLSLTKDYNNWQFTGYIDYRNRENSEIDSGLIISAESRLFLYEANQSSHSLNFEIGYDTSAEGTFYELEYKFYYALSSNSYLNINSGVSAVDNYHSLNGLNTWQSRMSYTHNLSKQVSISPFIESVISLNEAIEDTTLAGLWFEISF